MVKAKKLEKLQTRHYLPSIGTKIVFKKLISRFKKIKTCFFRPPTARCHCVRSRSPHRTLEGTPFKVLSKRLMSWNRHSYSGPARWFSVEPFSVRGSRRDFPALNGTFAATPVLSFQLQTLPNKEHKYLPTYILC